MAVVIADLVVYLGLSPGRLMMVAQASQYNERELELAIVDPIMRLRVHGGSVRVKRQMPCTIEPDTWR